MSTKGAFAARVDPVLLPLVGAVHFVAGLECVPRNAGSARASQWDSARASQKERVLLQPVTKSNTSASVGIALEQACLNSVDREMIEFFPEFAGKLRDRRTAQITVRQRLQVHGGLLSEQTSQQLGQALLVGDYLKRTPTSHPAARVPPSRETIAVELRTASSFRPSAPRSRRGPPGSRGCQVFAVRPLARACLA